MYKNYIITALRNLKRYKSYSVINLAGLSVGLAATILIYTFISHELSYDRFHENHERIYRVTSLIEMAGDHSIKAPITNGAMPPIMGEAVPEIRQVTRIENTNVEIRYGIQRFFNNNRLIVDSSFLEIFTFGIIEGNATDPLSEPGTIVITSELAAKIFGDRSAIGETITIGERDYLVNAVTQKIPANSHIKFDLLMSFGSLENEIEFINNRGFSFYTYLLLEEGADHREALEKTRVFIDEYYEETLKGMGLRVTSSLQPLSRIHLYSESMQFDMEHKGSISNVYIFALLALFILLIAIVNHVNLVTARSETRSREVAMRKVAGSSRYDLINQFISESLLTTVISLVIAISIVELFVQPFGNLMNREIAVNYLNSRSLIFLVLITLATGIGAGAYPAFYLSGFSPIRIFQRQSGSSPKSLLKVTLVVTQFSIAIFLIICLIVLQSQMHYMRNKSLGFNLENIIVIETITPAIRDNFNSIKNELTADPSVVDVTASDGIPGNQATVQNSWPAGGSREDAVMIFENRVQDNYFETYQIPVIEGRAFSGEIETDRLAFVINQAAARALGLDHPVGEDIFVWETRGTIIGVVSDFHFQSLHEPIKPIVHSRYSNFFGFLSVRISSGNIERTISSIGETLSKFDPDYIYNYSFLDDRLRSGYEGEERNNKLISMSAILSVILSVMGLYSLTSFTILRKTKEIGIRKAMGSTTESLLLMLYRNIGQWVVLANIIAWPSAWYFMNRWLENFAYRTEMELWMFLSAGLAALLVALITITGLAVKAAATNPVDALRYE
jgi:putative ABC transport system permease protein